MARASGRDCLTEVGSDTGFVDVAFPCFCLFLYLFLCAPVHKWFRRMCWLDWMVGLRLLLGRVWGLVLFVLQATATVTIRVQVPGEVWGKCRLAARAHAQQARWERKSWMHGTRGPARRRRTCRTRTICLRSSAWPRDRLSVVHRFLPSRQAIIWLWAWTPWRYVRARCEAWCLRRTARNVQPASRACATHRRCLALQADEEGSGWEGGDGLDDL